MAKYTIPAENLGVAKDKIAELAKKAAKLGVQTPVLTVLETRVVEQHFSPDGFPYVPARLIRLVDVEVEGTAPKIAGWTFVGTVQHTEYGNILRNATDQQIPEVYRDMERRCDHCGLVRNRIDTYIVHSDADGYRQVGSHCLKDFLGHQSPEAIIAYLTFLRDMFGGSDDEEWYGRGGNEGRLPLSYYLTHVTAIIRTHGWVSRAMVEQRGGYATSVGAKDNVHNREHQVRHRDGTPDWVDPIEEDGRLAEEAVTWVRGLNADNDYERNLVIACADDDLDPRNYGLAASVIVAYQRVVEQRAKQACQAVSSHIGTVGKRQAFTLRVESVRDLEGGYGVTHLHTLIDTDGNVLKWFASAERLQVGTTYKMTGAVKSHEEYRGVKQTVITRCKVTA